MTSWSAAFILTPIAQQRSSKITCCSADSRKPGKARTLTAESPCWWMMWWSSHRPCRPTTSPQATGLGRRVLGGRPCPIVPVSSDKARDAVYCAHSGLKTYNSQHCEASVFVNDDLTIWRATLAFDCRKLKKEKKIADAWTYNDKSWLRTWIGKIIGVGGPAVLDKL